MTPLKAALSALARALPPGVEEPTVDLVATYSLIAPSDPPRPMYEAIVRYFPPPPRRRRLAPRRRTPTTIHALGTSDVAAIQRATALIEKGGPRLAPPPHAG